jgi:hypothetical protein
LKKSIIHRQTFNQTILQASREVAAGNDEAYEKTMNQAFLLHLAAQSANLRAITGTGLYVHLPLLCYRISLSYKGLKFIAVATLSKALSIQWSDRSETNFFFFSFLNLLITLSSCSSNTDFEVF